MTYSVPAQEFTSQKLTICFGFCLSIANVFKILQYPHMATTIQLGVMKDCGYGTLLPALALKADIRHEL